MSREDASQQVRIETLGEELWRRIENAQGGAYLSDAQTDDETDDEKVLRDAAISLRRHQECVRILKDFLKGRA
jgi:hypothetical protein